MAVALVGAGCLTSASNTGSSTNANANVNIAATSGVRGTVTIGPTCPVERMPPDPACADKPYAGTFVITNASGAIVATFSSGADGSYSAALSPGAYVISLQKGNAMPSMAPQSFTVLTDAFTQLNLSLDSGIR